MMEVKENGSKEIKPTAHKYETRNTIKLLSSPAPSQLLTLKQKKSLFLKATYTALNYLGYPTESCEADYLDMFKFISCLFPTLRNIEKKSIYRRVKSLPAPEFVVITEVIQAVLLNHILLRENDTIYCKVGTDANNLKRSKKVEASHAPQWNQEFFIKTDCENTTVMIEVWLKPAKGKHHLIGTAYQDTKHIPSTGDEICIFIMDNNDPTLKQGYIFLRCFYNVVQLHLKLNILFQHIMFCYLCYEHRINNAQQLSHDVANHVPSGLYKYGLKKIFPAEIVTFLHQHALQHGLTPFENLACCYIVVCQYFVKMRKASLMDVDILLREITLLGKCPQKALDSELKSTLIAEISTSISKCSQLLCHIFSEVKDQEKEPLDLIVKYLSFVQEYYLESTTKRVTESIKSGTEFKPVEELTLSKDSTELSKETMENFVSKIFKTLHTLKMVDAVFLKELGVNYTSIVYERLDKVISKFFSSLLETALQGLDNRSLEEITLFMEIYFFLGDLILHIVNLLPSPDLLLPLDIVEHRQQLQTKVFHSYLQLLSDENEPTIISWIEDDKNEVGHSPFDEYIEMLLSHWKKLVCRIPEPPTEALIEVIENYYTKFGQLLTENLYKNISNLNKEDKIESKVDIAIELPTCICLNKMNNISNAINTICNEVRSTLLVHKEHKTFNLEEKLQYLTFEHYMDAVYADIQKKLKENTHAYLLSLADVDDDSNDCDKVKNELTFHLDGILDVRDTLHPLVGKKIFEIGALALEDVQKSLKHKKGLREILEHLQLYELIFEKNAT